MDLAEIRKKARLQNAALETVAQDSILTPAGGNVSPDSLPEISPDSFWDAEANQSLLTEEEYALTLQSHLAENDAVAQWLTFVCGEEEYSLELETVRELIRPQHLTELPQVPDWLLGIVSLRGAIVPVIDLARRLNLQPGNDVSQQRVIVCSSGDEQIGLLVDKVVQVVRVRPDQVEDTPLLTDSKAGDFIAGIGRVQGRMFILLNPERLLDVESRELLPG